MDFNTTGSFRFTALFDNYDNNNTWELFFGTLSLVTFILMVAIVIFSIRSALKYGKYNSIRFRDTLPPRTVFSLVMTNLIYIISLVIYVYLHYKG